MAGDASSTSRVDDSQLGPESFRTVDAIKTFVDEARGTANAG